MQNEGLKVIESIVEKQTDVALKKILTRVENKIELNSFTSLSWDMINIKEIELIKEIIKQLELNDYSYSVYIKSPLLNKDINQSYTSYNRKYVFVPNAKMASSFIELRNSDKLLTRYFQHAEEINNEEKEYE
ncbi:MAG: hypothetical protein HFJ29_04210 [Clostridia bacterium]|nr:hypothetical protein [Clostridia bacterium]